VTGYGNTTLNFSADLITEEEGESHPSLSFSYSVKLPTGSQSKGLGSGRVDHEYVAAIGKTLSRRTSFEVDLGGYSAGNTDRRGFTTTGEMALMLDHILGSLETKKYKLHNEIDLSTRARDTQSEIFSLHWVTFKLSKHFSLRTGVRAGITPNSPRIGGFGTIIYTGSFRK
jgi:hypothetical protein